MQRRRHLWLIVQLVLLSLLLAGLGERILPGADPGVQGLFAIFAAALYAAVIPLYFAINNCGIPAREELNRMEDERLPEAQRLSAGLRAWSSIKPFIIGMAIACLGLGIIIGICVSFTLVPR